MKIIGEGYGRKSVNMFEIVPRLSAILCVRSFWILEIWRWKENLGVEVASLKF